MFGCQLWRYGALGQIGSISIYGTLGLKNSYQLEKMELNRIYGPTWALNCLFTNFGVNVDVRPFTGVVCKKFSIFYEKHEYGCPRGLKLSIALGEPKAHLIGLKNLS